ncbi:MAG: peptidase M28, partial [Brevundimonas sp.]
MSKRHGLFIAALLASVSVSAAVSAQAQEAWVVKPAWVSAHENFLASPALRGRGSATSDETVAATYVASMFELYGLTPAPGMTGYLQSAPVIKTTPSGHSTLKVGD